MEIILSVSNLNQVGLDVDSFLLGTVFGVRNEVFSLEEIAKTIEKTDKPVYVNMDKIIHEDELESCEKFINELSKLDIAGIYYSDMAVYEIAKLYNLLDKLVLNQHTLITSTDDCRFYLDLGIRRVCLARELTFEEIIEFKKQCSDIEIIIHGYLNMFYSKRKTLTNYSNNYKLDNEKKGYLREEIRDEFYPVVEDSTGTHIFQDKILNSFNELENFSDISCRIDSFLLDSKYVEYVVDIYNELRKDFNSENALRKYKEKYSNLSSGFYYKKSTYMKK